MIELPVPPSVVVEIHPDSIPQDEIFQHQKPRDMGFGSVCCIQHKIFVIAYLSEIR
jgi:hypothetical protein